MSVPNQIPYITYNANGLTTVFPFEFYIISSSDIQVSLNGVIVTTGYSVSGVGNVSGGDVTFLTPPTSGTVVMLERVVPTYRLTDYQDNGDLLADTVNKDFDRLWMAIQRSFIYLGLALRRPLFGGPFDADGYRISELADPVNPQDAATKNYVDNVSLVRALRVPESYVPVLPPADQRANKLLACNSVGNPIFVLPATGSATEVMIELAKADGRKYLGKVPTIADLRNTEPTYDKQWIDVEKYWADSLPPQGSYWNDASDTTSTDNGGTIIVTAGGARWKFIGKPTVETYGAYADGRDDSAAFTRCIAAEDFISFPGDLYGVLNIQPIRNNQIFQGGSTTELRIITGGLATSAAFSFVLTYREGVVFRDFSISTDTVGLGKGFYSPSNIYVANPTIENINFKASLAFAIDANLILALVRDCWFGLEGTLYSSYMHVRCAGQSPVGSNLTTNANLFENCRFFRSNSAYGIDIQNGLQFIMRNCDFETNNNTSGLIRVAGILSVHFEECWWERNAGIQIVKVQMDSTGTTQGCQVISFDKCWIKLDGSGNTCALLSDTNNFNVSFSHCAGSQFASKALFKVNTTSDPLGYLKFFTDNYLVGWSVFTQNNTWVPELLTNSVEYDDPATGVRLGKITANSSRIILSHNSGVVIQNSAGKVLAEVVTTATGTQIRALSQDGTTMWKLQPPTSGTTPTAAQWTPV